MNSGGGRGYKLDRVFLLSRHLSLLFFPTAVTPDFHRPIPARDFIDNDSFRR